MFRYCWPGNGDERMSGLTAWCAGGPDALSMGISSVL